MFFNCVDTGQLTGHFPEAGWLRPMCSLVKSQFSGMNWEELIDKVNLTILIDILEILFLVQCLALDILINLPEGTWI